MKTLILFFIFLSFSIYALQVMDTQGKPLPGVMVTQKNLTTSSVDISDNGYQKPLLPQIVFPEITKFTNDKGEVFFAKTKQPVKYRLRKMGFKDLEMINDQKIILEKENDLEKLAEQKPANIWLGALDLGNAQDKIIFKMQCGFCHQQGTSFTRAPRNPSEWKEVNSRMIRYGSRLPSDLQKTFPQKLSDGYQKLRNHLELLAEAPSWQSDLARVTLTEWPIGDSMSQVHDMIVGINKNIYVADNIQDRLYEINPSLNTVTVYKIPHLKNDVAGGLISARLKEFPKHDSTSNAHSLVQSKKDGHIFITPSAQRRLIEFDPVGKKFLLHEMSEGFYPHTIRIDSQDNVWFTLALSNQVAKFDRQKKSFSYFDLPARSFKEKMITQNIGFLFKLMSWGIPLSNWLKIERDFNGTPLVYGIEITNDDTVWVARLHTNEIGRIDSKTHKVEMIKTPFWGPRRLRADKDNNLWITSFGESKIAKYSPQDKTFKLFDLPVNPKGSETPYSLNVDKPRDLVWVTGNQSNAAYVFDIKKEKWVYSIPFARQTTFTRDFDFDQYGTAYTSNSNFPSWQIEDSQPTLIQIKVE
jgi:virginiamycin B lyase